MYKHIAITNRHGMYKNRPFIDQSRIFNIILKILQAVMQKSLQDQWILGVPPTVRYHGGWKKWRLDAGGSTHSFLEKDIVLKAAAWAADKKAKLQVLHVKELSQKVKNAGLKVPRQKEELVEINLRLAYKSQDFPCVCCHPLKAHWFDERLC